MSRLISRSGLQRTLAPVLGLLLCLPGCKESTSPGTPVPAQLAFLVAPTSATGGAALNPAVAVAIQDAQGNTVTSATTSITLVIGANAGGGTLSGTATVAAVSGVATFSNLSIDKAGTGYTLVASASGLTSATSAAFNVTAGAASKLAFTVQPTNATAGAAMGPAVTVQDALGNTVTTATTSITVAIATNPASGTLSGTATAAAVSGTATFANLTIDKAGTGYTLTATATSLTSAMSNAFAVAPGPAAKLALTVQPTSATAGATISPAVAVTVQDALGNTVTTASTSVTLAIGTNPGGGTLSGTATVAAVSGVATFSNLRINKVGTGYTLTAGATSLTSATSTTFNVTVGAASKLAFTVQPTTATAGAAISPAVAVTVQDAQGNTVTNSTASLTLAITSGTGTTGAVLGGTLTQSAVSGVATFANLTLDKVGTGYTLTAGTTSLTGATSTAFNVTAGATTKLAFTVQPTTGTAGAAISPAVAVTVQDAQGNTVTSSTASLTLAITSGTGTTGAVLGGTLTQAAVNGVATFANLTVDKAGTGYTLTATGASLTSATSSTFAVNAGAAAKLAFTVQPSTVAAGAAITPAVQVTVQDTLGNTVTSSTASITLAITGGTGTSGAVLGGTLTQAAVSGLATYANLTFDKVGTGYTLTATTTGLTSATSSAFAVNAGAAAKLAFTVQPSTVTAGAVISPAIQVTVQDAQGNTVTSSTASITLAITSGTGTSGAVLGGTLTRAAASGVATFSNLTVDKAGTGYTLTAAATGLTGATSTAFTVVTTGAGTHTANGTYTWNATTGVLTFNVTSSNFTCDGPSLGTETDTGLTVASTTMTWPQSGMTWSRSSGTAGNIVGTWTATESTTGDSYTVTFNADMTLSVVGVIVQCGGGGGGQTPTELAFRVQPSAAAAGTAITPAVQVTVQDAQGNTVTSSTASITLAITSGTGTSGAVLGGTLTRAAVNGVATFSNLTVDKAGTGYTLTAAATGLTGATSTAFNVTTGAGTHTATGTYTWNSTTRVLAVNWISSNFTCDGPNLGTETDTGLTVTSTTMTWPQSGMTWTRTSGTAGNIVGTWTATESTTGDSYTVTFNADMTLSVVGVIVQCGGGGGGQSPTKLAFTVQPSPVTAGATISPAVQVTVQDAQGNTVTSSTASITLAITSGTGTSGAVLGGTLTRAAVSGVATFSNLSVDKAGTGYTLTATATSLTSATSGAFAVNAGAGAALFPIANTPGREMSLGGAAFDGTNFLVGIQGDATDDNSITAQFVSKTGTLVGSRISTGTTGGAPMVAFDGANYLLLWAQDADVKTSIFGRLVSTSGALVGSQFTVATGTDMSLGSVIFDGINYLVTWGNESTPGQGDTRDVFGQFVTPSGATLGSVIPISTAVHGQRDPAIAFDGTNILAVWSDGRNQSACYTDVGGTQCSESDVYGQVITQSGVSAAGTLSGGNVLIDAGTLPRNGTGPGIAFDGTNYLVTFTEEVGLSNACPANGCNWEAYGIHVTKTGAAIGSRFVIGSTTTSKMLALPTFLGSKYLVTWTDGFATTSQSIKGMYVSTLGTVEGSEFTLFSPAPSGTVPVFAFVSTGGGANLAIMTWAFPNLANPYDFDQYTSMDVMGSIMTLP